MGSLFSILVQLSFSTLAAFPFLWVNHVLDISSLWVYAIVAAVALTAVPPTQWQKLPRFSTAVYRLLAFAIIALVALLAQWSVVQLYGGVTAVFLITLLLLLTLSFLYPQPGAVANLTLATFSLLFTLFLANIGAGIALAQLEQAAAPPPTPEPTPTAAPLTIHNSPATSDSPQSDNFPAPTQTPEPTPTATPIPTLHSPLSPTPEPTRPIAGFGYLEWLEDNGEAEWTHLTAYGPRINSVAHATMYDSDGNLVYDTIVEYNGKGYRGPEVAYEKPADVYRILIIGDSFVEAIQMPYEQTFQAQLQNSLSQHDTPERRYEVVAMGRTGWGTMHEAVYYQVEGYKYNADLVILMFYINDVADNLPSVFYPNINNTNYDFVINKGQVQILDTNQQPLPPNNGRLLYNALHWRLRQTNLAKLFIRLADPPIPIVTPGGVMTRVHPQFYIYVTEPEVEGYAEGWQRTAVLLHHLAQDVQNDGAQFAVVPIFLGSEMVSNVSGWFPELVEEWQWDDGLPEQRLAEILAGTSAELWPTRPTFEAYARSVDGQVYNLIYLPEDGHFNALGHQLTYEAIYNWLVEAEIVR